MSGLSGPASAIACRSCKKYRVEAVEGWYVCGACGWREDDPPGVGCANCAALEMLLSQSKKNTEDAIAVIKASQDNADAAISLVQKAQATAEAALELARRR